ncbi:inositol monophosphatase [Dissulfurirhabdus thermomarina]|uniref:Inositol-1-monophosphatase n=1 Tax=Dissulfurirhabdus thermomarina TaxID=1765737 RepID=A0A6N9TP12_DISTH|nr:inositol monophosphatase family protein [Dissulfurirhabdus thermomarina]NDY42170.1 inositol monophosphatase [Dissulfurirhabdus thermomarina]NMX22400.1 inositol monophosphatase [Dissulfurirhabdus thermomarina]
MTPELDTILDAAREAARRAGRLLMEYYGRPLEVRHKGTIDLVTEADLASERVLLADLRERFPGHGILSEEDAGAAGAPPEGPTWIVDPLDGTTNFAHGYPWFAVSVAFMDGGRVQAGAVYHPVLDECLWAGRGRGAWLNDAPVRVSAAADLGEALLATGFPYDVQERPAPVLEALGAVLVRAQGIRRAGSAALDLAGVACGRLDGFWEIKLKPWDTAAGALLVEEAGGRVSTFDGGPWSPFTPEIAASNGRLHGAMLDLLGPFAGRTR